MRISDWSSDVCSSDLERQHEEFKDRVGEIITGVVKSVEFGHVVVNLGRAEGVIRRDQQIPREVVRVGDRVRSIILNVRRENRGRSEEHTSELQSLMRISYAVFCLKKKNKRKHKKECINVQTIY